jgi:hypothetical protein
VIECDLARNKNREALAALRRQGRSGMAAWGVGGSFGNHQQGFVVRPGGFFVRMTMDSATTAFLAGALQNEGRTLRDWTQRLGVARADSGLRMYRSREAGVGYFGAAAEDQNIHQGPR